MTDFALRIFLTDHYLCKPLKDIDIYLDEYTKKPVSQIPILRVFGSTPKGQKVCAHIHGVYPYFYVPFFEDFSIILNKEKLDKFLINFTSSLNSAIDLSMKFRTTSDSSHIFRITLVKGKPFYGYQEHYQYFLKIYLYNPFLVKKTGDLLLSGAVMNKPIQPYETHIPYNLKFFIDYNLYGMNYLYTDAAMFRVKKDFFPEGSLIDLNASDYVDLSQKMWNTDQLPPDCMMDERVCSKSTSCELEVDICACDILNIQEVQKNIGENPGLKDLWDEEKQRRIKLGLNLADLVGEVFEERPMARSTESQMALLEEWKEICTSVKDEVVPSQDVDAFIYGSSSGTEEDEDWDLNESVNEDSIKTALKSGDSFVLEAMDSNKDVDSEGDIDDRELCEFINACIKMEEEDSIIHDRNSDTMSSATKELLTKKCSSFSQQTAVVVDLVDDQSDSDEDLFNRTFIDLSLDDSNDEDSVPIGTDSKEPRRNVSSDDLFDADSFEISSDSEDAVEGILMTHDGADDDDDDDFDTDIFTHKTKRRKTDHTKKSRTPVLTRSKLKLDSRGQQIKSQSYLPEKPKRKKPKTREKKLIEIENKSIRNTVKTTTESMVGVENKMGESSKTTKDSDLNKSVTGNEMKQSNISKYLRRPNVSPEKFGINQKYPVIQLVDCCAHKLNVTNIMASHDNISMDLTKSVIENDGNNASVSNMGIRSDNTLDNTTKPVISRDMTRKGTSKRRQRPNMSLKIPDSRSLNKEIHLFDYEDDEQHARDADVQRNIISIDLTDSVIGSDVIKKEVSKDGVRSDTISIDLTKSVIGCGRKMKGIPRHRKRPNMSLKIPYSCTQNSITDSGTNDQNNFFDMTKVNNDVIERDTSKYDKVSSSKNNENVSLDTQHTMPTQGRSSFQTVSSTPLRSNLAPFNIKFSDISPIMKTPNNRSNRVRTVSFSIPEVSQESPDKSVLKSQSTQKLDALESMKKTVSQSLQDISYRGDFLSQRFQASMMSHLTLMSCELHCTSRSTLRPNPTIDSILMFFYVIHHETDLPNGSSSSLSVYEEGVVYVDEGGHLLSTTGIAQTTTYRTIVATDEAELLNEVIGLVMKFDPDVLLGYETTRSSWGYVLERSFHLKHSLYHGLGRLLNDERKDFKKNECSFNELHVAGRIILDLWVVMKHELTLTSYTIESVVDDVLKERVPSFTNQQLMVWYRSNHERFRVVNYWKYRVSANLRLLTKLDLISRTSEFAKIYGIEFYHVLSRGSQYRVEAMMLRLAKPQNLIALSPSVHQRAKQKAPECIPLTLEPESGLHKDPVVVLDFQSLYPSVMIAYNYCFSTSLGKLSHIKSVNIGETFEFGCGELSLDEDTVRKVTDEVNVSPNEVAFVRPQTFKGIISKMVEEILTTRIMVKKSMKIHKDDKALCKLLDSRQLGLKLIANVTFGYTAASFSGRMPCVEVGDSILRKSRETLEEAILLVNSGGPDGFPQSDEEGGWEGCKVIYGDTDSMFVLMPGRTKEEAFTLGARLADAVTAINPFPVKLKFEKVFLPCLLEAKKRYVGYSYETLDQERPKFDAKGIETVRRDNCNIVGRILERTLIRLLDLNSLDSIKKYVTLELEKVASGKVNMIDFIIAKEYRGRQTYRPGASVPALHIANNLKRKDPRSEPLPGERVPYVIVQGGPGDTLLSCVRQPCELLFNTKILKSYGNNIRSLSEQGCALSYIYYLTKQILPPLHRALNLVGVDVFKWYSQMPKRAMPNSGGRGGATVLGSHMNRTISSYFISQKCMLCEGVVRQSGVQTAVEGVLSSVLCARCLGRGGGYVYYTGTMQLRDIEDQRVSVLTQCALCTGSRLDLRGVGPPCVSMDCPVFFDRIRACQTTSDDLHRLLDSDPFYVASDGSH